MHITWLEMKKAILSPVILTLLVLCISFNIFLTVSQSYKKEELTIVNEIVQIYGPTFDDKTLMQMEQDILQMVVAIDGTDTLTFLEGMSYEKYEQASLKQQQQIDKISLLYAYVQTAKGLEIRYATVDIPKMKEQFLQEQNMPNWLERMMVKEYDQWQVRFNEMIETNEYKQWFFLGEYRMHSELFRSLMKNLALEGVLIVVLLTALITNYEFENRTQLVTYATKKGRSLIWHKGFASLICSIIVICALFGVSLITFFSVYDYSGLWQTPISSGLNWEYRLPYITWWAVPLWQYLILAILILVVALLIIAMLTFTVSIFVENSYITWILCVLFLVAMFVVPTYFSSISTLQWLMYFNISLLLINPHMYFSGGDTFMMVQYHEVTTLLLWLLVAVTASLFAIRYFKRKDVV